jgi:Tol biopolymer transport system component
LLLTKHFRRTCLGASAVLVLATQAAVPIQVHAAVPTFPFQAGPVFAPPSVGPDYVITSIAIGPDGRPWVGEGHPWPSCNSEIRDTDPGCHYDGHLHGKIARLNLDGTFTEFEIPVAYSYPGGLVWGPDGNLWFIDRQDEQIAIFPTFGRMTPSGQVDEFQFSLPPPNHEEFGALIVSEFTLGSDGNLYFLGHYGGNQAYNDLLGRVTMQGVVSWIPLFQFNFVYGGRIVSVGGVLWFTGTQYDGCPGICYATGTASLNYYVPSTNTLGEERLGSDVHPGAVAAGPGDGSVWVNPASNATIPSGIGRVDRAGRLTVTAMSQFIGSVLVGGSDNRMYGANSSGCGGLSRVDQLAQVSEAIPIPGSIFSPIVLDPTGTLWGVSRPGCPGATGSTGVQSIKNLDGTGPAAPPLGPASAAFTATQSFLESDGTGNSTVPVDLDACASTGDFSGYNWTVAGGPVISTSVCDFRTTIPAGDVSVTFSAAGVPGGPALSSVAQIVHTVPHASFSHLVDQTHTNSPTIRVLLNPCQSSGIANIQFTVLDQTFGNYLTASPLPSGDPTRCGYWFVDVNPGYPYSVTLNITGPLSTNGAQDSMTRIVMEQMQPVFTVFMDQVTHDVQNTTVYVNACNSIGVASYQWTLSNPAGSIVAGSTADPSCSRAITNVPLHVNPSDTSSKFAYYTLTLGASSGAASSNTSVVLSMMSALAPPPTFAGCSYFSLGPDNCLAILGGDIWSSFGTKRPPDFLAFNVGITPLTSAGLIIACDGSVYLTAALNTPALKKIVKIKDAIEAVISGAVAANSVAFGWVGNPQDAPPTNGQIDDFVGPGPVGYQIGGAVPAYGMYFLRGEVFGQPQFGLMEVHGFVPDLSVSAGSAVLLAGAVVRSSICADGAWNELKRVMQSGQLPPLQLFGTPSTSVNVSTATTPLNVAPGQTVGVTGSGFTPATQFGAALHSQQITLGIGTTDANGNVSFSFTVPSGLSSGSHLLTVTGWSQGQPRELTATLNVSTRTLTGTGAAIQISEGSAFSGQVAGFIDTSPGDVATDFTAGIDWGDGSTSTGTVSGPAGGPFVVSGTHPYAEEGLPAVTTTLKHTASGLTGTAQSAATVADPGVNATGGYQVSSLEGSDSGSQRVATFTDPAGAEPNPSDPTGTHYAATIAWGDGASSTGTVTGPDGVGVFTVSGSHPYSEEGAYQLQVTIHHEGAPDATASSAALIKPRNGEILFSKVSTASGSDHHSHIWAANPDGTNQHALTSGSSEDLQPVWSPDGTRIAFTSTRNGFTHIFVMNADGTGLTAVTSGYAFDLDPTWSPDGSKIAFTSTRGGHTHIYVVSSSGGTPTALTSGWLYEATPAWSPDGLHIAFTRTSAGYTHIFVMKSDGTGVAQLTSGSFYDAVPAWSPDSTRVAFTSNRGGNTHIYVMQNNGAGLMSLTSGPAFDALPAWAADGSLIAFTSTRSGQVHVFVMNADGTGVSALTFGQSVDAFPTWRAAE